MNYKLLKKPKFILKKIGVSSNGKTQDFGSCIEGSNPSAPAIKKMNKLKLFTGNSNPNLAKEIANYLQKPLAEMEVKQFPDGEIFVKINESVRGIDVFIIQSGCRPVNINLMELLIIIDALKRASAKRITAVIPYYCYARQDRKGESRVPITAKLIADLLTAAGADRILTMDLHVGQIQGFFNIPVDNLYASPIFINYFKKKFKKLKNFVVVAPDAGRVNYSRTYATKLNIPLAIIDKRRPEQSKSEVMNVIGNIKDKNVIIFDDIIDTAGTVTTSTYALKEKGAKDIYIVCTHPVFSLNAFEKLNEAPIKEVVITNTIPFNNKCEKIKIVSVAPLLGKAIEKIHNETSIGSLFE